MEQKIIDGTIKIAKFMGNTECSNSLRSQEEELLVLFEPVIKAITHLQND